MHIAIVTAGGAGMFCGSCMHDNTWARALMAAGHEVTLIPTYTPIRVDEQNLSVTEVFLGGINVYLDHKLPFWRKVPRPLVRWLDSPTVIRLATKFGVSNNASQLGPLTLAMLAGESGPNRREIDEFAAFMDDLSPDVIIFSNALLVGALRSLRQRMGSAVDIYCMLQGDDIFLMDLPEKFRTSAITEIHERCRDFDGFLTHSQFYRDFISEFLSLPVDRFHRVPLGIDVTAHDGQPTDRGNDVFTVGYFARVCPEKGLHHLVDMLKHWPAASQPIRIVSGGYRGKRDRKYFRSLQKQTRKWGDRFSYVGSPATHAEKVALFKSFDVLCIPTDYHEPKGLPILEALANGTPVVQPAHGAFPEIIEKTQGGLLYAPGNRDELTNTLTQLMRNPEQRLELAANGHRNVRREYSNEALAKASLKIFESKPSAAGATHNSHEAQQPTTGVTEQT